MRRRLKTVKKTKKETNSKKTLSKKTPSKKTKKQKATKKEKEKKEVSKKTTVSVRVLARPKKSKKSKKPVIELEIDREKELEKKKEEARRGKKIEKYKTGEPRVINNKAEVENEIERHKMIIMWSGMIFFMVLISVFWISNTKRVVEKSKVRISQESETKSVEWDDLVDELSDKIVEMKGDLKNIDEFNNGRDASSTPATLSESTEAKIRALTEDEFKKVNEKIEPELKDKIRFIY